jgi:hypothetical protein
MGAGIRFATLLALFFSRVLPTCIFQTPQGTFNLTALPVVEAYDANAWRYLISPCRSLSPWQASASCLNTDGRGQRSPAFQVQPAKGLCKRLGTLSNLSFAPLAGRVGITLTLGGGDACGTVTRSVTLTVVCPSPLYNKDDASCPIVTEPRSCAYAAVVQSTAGCPLLCARDHHGAVCGGAGRGECTLNGCQCASGRTGPSCTDLVSAPRALRDVANVGRGVPFFGSRSLLILILLLLVTAATFRQRSLFALAVICFLMLTMWEAGTLALLKPHDPAPLKGVEVFENGEDGSILVISRALALDARQLQRSSHPLLGNCDEADTPAPAFIVYPGANGPCFRIGGGLHSLQRAGGSGGGEVSVVGGSPCCRELGSPLERLTRFSFACSGSVVFRVLQPRACGHDIFLGSPSFCDAQLARPALLAPCSAEPRGTWELSQDPEDKSLNLGSFASAYETFPLHRSHLFVPQPPCRMFGAQDALECFRDAEILFLGDSTLWDPLRHAATALAGCGQPFPHAQGWRASELCDDVRAWLKRSEEPGATDTLKCLSPRACTTPLHIASHNITLRALRYMRLSEPAAWERPYYDELLINCTVDPRNTVMLLNMAAHDLHFTNADGWNSSGRLFLGNLARFFSALKAAPAWQHQAARASGLLSWRSLFPTEHPAVRDHLGALKDPVSWFRTIDAQASAIVREADFQVVDLAGAVFDERGNNQRLLTYDSTHYRYAESNQIFSFAWAQLCESLKKRRAGAYS